MSTLKVDTLQNATGENFVFGNKNLVINGGMNIFQRNTLATGKTSSGYYSADRFRHTLGQNGTMGTWTYSRSTDVPSGQGFGYSLKLDCTTAGGTPNSADFHSLQHRIEGQNLQHLLKGSSSAKALTLSFWVKSNKTGTYITSILDNDNTRNISKSYTINSANTWEKKEITFAGDTTGAFDNDNQNSLQLEFFFGAGTDYTTGTLATSWESYTAANRMVGQVNLSDSTSNELYLAGIQLETGSVATDFDFEPYATTLIKCQRYYEKSYDDAVKPGTANVQGHHLDGVGAQSYPRTWVPFVVRKRTTSYTWTDYRQGATDTVGANLWEFTNGGTTRTVGTSNQQRMFTGAGIEANWTSVTHSRSYFYFHWIVDDEL